MLARAEPETAADQVVGKERFASAGPLAGGRVAWLDVGGRIAVEPVHAVPPSDQPLELAKGRLGRIPEPSVEFRRSAIVIHQPRGRGETSPCHVRGRVRRHRRRVDRDAETTALELPRGRESHRPATDYRGLPALVFERHLGHPATGAPGERDPGASVPVVVDDGGAVELVGAQHEPRGAVRPKPHGSADDPVPRHVHDGQAERGLPREDVGTGRAGAEPRAQQASAAES